MPSSSQPAEYAGYLVYPDGRVWRPEQVRVRRDGVARRMRGGWVATRTISAARGKAGGAGYRVIDLWIDHSSRTILLHRLVAICFVPNPENKPEVNHDDGDRANCCATNLAWMTKSENQLHAVQHVHKHHGVNHRDAKLTAEQVRELRQLRKAGTKLNDLAVRYGVCFQTISAVARGERYAFVT